MPRIRKPSVERTCRKCGAKFFEWPYAIREGKGNFCSIQCSREEAHQRRSQTMLARRPVLTQPSHGEWFVVPLKDGTPVKVSPDDYEWAASVNWTIRGGYATNRRLGMHRLVLSRALGRPLLSHEQVDHINRDSLDNRRANLRVASPGENVRNKTLTSSNSSGFIGVSWCSQTSSWRSVILLDRARFHIGRFKDIEEAAWMRDQFAIELHGDFAVLNFDYQ